MNYANDNPEVIAAVKMVETVNDIQNALIGTENTIVNENLGSYVQGPEEKNMNEISNMLINIRNG